jgi:tetratricopeptide (TPR) repeat protein
MNGNLLRRLSLLLALVAVVYAALACLRTVGDFDTGWQLATGRYHFQHHAIPSTDVLSYTSTGAPWIYPPFAGAILYKVFQAFGYAGLTWFCVLAAALLAGWILWRAIPARSLATAALLVMAIPSIAYRLTPRADLFTTLFFAIVLAELWRFHRGQSARLWLLPPIMFLWVNLHPGFIAGLGLLAAYLLMEVLLLPFRDLRAETLVRLAKSWPWLAASASATLLNPWGTAAMRQSLTLAGVYGAGVSGNSHAAPRFIGELSSAPLSWRLLPQAFEFRNPDSSFWWLLAAAATGVLLALRRRQFGAAALLGVAMAAAIEHLRYQGLFAIIVTIVAGTLLADAFAELAAHPPVRLRMNAVLPWAGVTLVAVLCAITALRVADLASNRYYIVNASPSIFGAGESWWFPERAADFIEHEKLPGNIFQPYNLGGWTALRLGPTYPDYIDGRGVSQQVSEEEQLLLSQSPDSATWQQVAARRNINIMVLSLARYAGLGGFDLPTYCEASTWQPVYLDELSLVLVRRTPQNQPWLDRLAINCQSASLTGPSHPTKFGSYNFLSNSGAVYYALARDAEAEAAWRKAEELEPEDPNLHLFLAQLYQQSRPAEAEREYRAALALRESSPAWYALGRLLAGEHRYAEAETAIANSIPLTPTPANQYKALAQVQLRLKKAAQAQENLKQAEHDGPPESDSGPSACEFRAQIAEGRAEVANQSGNIAQAIELQQEAVRQTPQSASRWTKLAALATAANRPDVAGEATHRAQELNAALKH